MSLAQDNKIINPPIMIHNDEIGGVWSPLDRILCAQVSPLQFGAIGNGIADDTIACQRAADHAQQIAGAVVFPSGYTFGIQAMIIIRNGVRGVLGKGGRIQYLAGVNMCGILLAGIHSGNATNVSECLIDGLHVDCQQRWGVAIYAENVNRCIITNNTILGVEIGHGIALRCFLDGGGDSYSNIVSNNIVHGNTSSAPQHHGIVLDSEIDFAPYVGADSYWKAIFTAKEAQYKNTFSVISGNRVLGSYYGISLSGIYYSTITGNVVTENVRNISLQNGCRGNTVTGNTLVDSYSSAVHLAYGSSNNVISDNNVYSTRANGQGLLQAYIGSQFNKFTGNQITIAGAGNPQWHLYCAVQSHGNVFSDNVLRGATSRAYIAVESAFDNTVTNPAHYGYQQSTDVNNFANGGMSDISIRNNTIYPSSSAPAIFLAQITDAGGTYALSNIEVSGNRVVTSTVSRQLELYEETTGSLYDVTLKNNLFTSVATLADFVFPRGRQHFSRCLGNSVVNDSVINFVAGDTTPSIAVGDFFQHQDVSPTNVTYYDDGVNDQEIIIRLSTNTTIVNNSNLIRLKGGVNAAGDSNNFVAFRRISDIWFETWRNF